VQPVPPTLPDAVRDVSSGVVPLPDSILLLLDPDRAADLPTTRISGGIS
jgi:purine-binding chemotaxis protein CheW